METSEHRASCYGAIGELQCDGEHYQHKTPEAPSLIERMVHLSKLRGEWVQAMRIGTPSTCNAAAMAYVDALEAECERSGIVIDRSGD